MPERPWTERVDRRLRRWAVGSPAWVVAVSGGGDSVALLRVLHGAAPAIGLRLSVAHLDHGARGEASRADAAFVADLAETLGLPCDLGRWAPARPGHFEADARRARYAWLAGVARARGASAVAAGHTRDDQAETVLHRVVRGTGPHGLAGIPPRRTLAPGLTLVRPLLDVSRAELRDYLDALGQPSREDASNADLSRTRARLRHDLLPKLADDYNPNVADALARLAKFAARERRHRLRDLERLSAWTVGPDEIVFQTRQLEPLPGWLRAEAIRSAWRGAGWPEGAMDARRWQRLARAVRRRHPRRFDAGAGVSAEVGPEFFTLSRATGPPEAPPPRLNIPLTLPGAADWPGGRVVVTTEPDAPRDETVDLDRLDPPLCVRSPEPGDRFAPLGLNGRSQPLNDFFRGRHVSRDARAGAALVCDASGIVWVVGQRIADRVKLTNETTRRAGLRWEPRDAPRNPPDDGRWTPLPPEDVSGRPR